MQTTVTVVVTAENGTTGIPGAIAYALDNPANYPDDTDTSDWGVSVYDPGVQPGQDPDVMPAAVHGEPVVSAFRHLPLLGRLDDTYTVITRGEDGHYNVLRTRFAPALGRWSIDTSYRVANDLSWARAGALFTLRITSAQAD